MGRTGNWGERRNDGGGGGGGEKREGQKQSRFLSLPFLRAPSPSTVVPPLAPVSDLPLGLRGLGGTGGMYVNRLTVSLRRIRARYTGLSSDAAQAI